MTAVLLTLRGEEDVRERNGGGDLTGQGGGADVTTSENINREDTATNDTITETVPTSQ